MDDVQAMNLLTLFIRVSLGAMIFVHGYSKVFRGGGLSGTAGWFESIGLKPGFLHARLASFTEMGSGVLILLGLGTQFGCAALVGLMAVAGVTAHGKKGFLITKDGWEYNYIIATLAITLAGLGAGRWSLDNALDLPFAEFSIAAGMAIAAGLGVGGAALLLTVFWRPPTSS
jgi:putative oxidoreductase